MKLLSNAEKVNQAQANLQEPVPYTNTVLLRSKGGVPLTCSDAGIPSKSVKQHPIFGHYVGKPFSLNALEQLDGNPERRYVLSGVIRILQENSGLLLIMTSHDQSRSGARRRTSTGHLAGWSSDYIWACPSGSEEAGDAMYYPVLDLMNSISFFSYLRSASVLIHQLLLPTINKWNGRELIIGVEYDHVHFEWPWSNRVLPAKQSTMRLTDIASGLHIGTFYNPQPIYGMPPSRSSIEGGILLLL